MQLQLTENEGDIQEREQKAFGGELLRCKRKTGKFSDNQRWVFIEEMSGKPACPAHLMFVYSGDHEILIE